MIAGKAPFNGSTLKPVKNDNMTKEQILNEWQPGDDSEAVRILKRQHAVEVSRHAIAAWRKRANNRSPLTPFYIAAFKAAIHNRKNKNQ